MRIILNARHMASQEEAHRYLRERFGFPEYYGGNLDALYDCLMDFDNLKIEISEYSEKSEYLEKIIRVMSDAGALVSIR